MKANKGEGIVYNWIFILIAGAIILIIFTIFIIDFKNLTERKQNTELAIKLEENLEALSTSKAVLDVNPEGIDVLEARFTCNEFTLFNSNPINYRGKFIFAPSDLKDDSFIMWLEQFNFPYTMTNLIYIVPKNIKYYIIYDESSKEFVKNLLAVIPKKFNTDQPIINIELITNIDDNKINQDIKLLNLREIKFLAFKPVSLPAFPIKTDILMAEPKEYGIIKYDNQDSYYFSLNLLLAGLISDNYDCILDNLVNKIEILNDIHKEKSRRLWIKTQTFKPECNYNLIYQSFPGDYNDYNALYERQKLLADQNKKLFELGCEDVF